MEPVGDEGNERDVLVYRADVLTRCMPALVAIVLLGLWGTVIVQTGDTAAVPAVLALTLLASGGIWWITARHVVITPVSLTFRTFRGSTSMAWNEISALQLRFDVVWAHTADGWFVVPLPGSRRPRGSAPGTSNLGNQVWFSWLAGRGDDWAMVEPRPWAPNRDRRGRAVLRPAWFTRSSGLFNLVTLPFVLTLVPVGAQNQEPLTARLGVAAVLSGLALGAAAGYHAWSRVTIDEDVVVVRSLTGGVARLDRERVIAIGEEVDRMPVGGGGLTRLAVTARQPVSTLLTSPAMPPTTVVRLVAPATAARWWSNDPAYYRVWSWLYDELVVRDRDATASVPTADADTDPTS